MIVSIQEVSISLILFLCNHSHIKFVDIVAQPKMNPIEEQYLRKSKSTFMSAGWGINKRSFNNVKGSKSTNKLKTDRTQDSSPKTQKLNNHKSFTNMKTLNDNLRGNKFQ